MRIYARLRPLVQFVNYNYLLRFRCSVTSKPEAPPVMEAKVVLTQTQRYAAGALFALALHQTQIHQTKPLNALLPLEEETISDGAGIGRIVSVSDDPGLWIHESSGLLYPVLRFLGVEDKSWKGLKETAGSSSQVRHHVGAFLTLLKEETAKVASAENTEKEVALTKTVDSMVRSEESADAHAVDKTLASIGNTCLAAVQAYDSATESIEALNAAELKFQDIIDSSSVDAACRKIDNLAEKNQLDSTLVMMITKAWSAAKESSMTKDEVKDVLYHLYVTARSNLQKLMPKEIRIVKYLLTIDNPEERLSALQDAFTPGEELEREDVDNLYTTPEKLHTWIKAVVDAYHLSREGTLIREARDLMNPRIIKKLEELKKVVEKKFL